MKKLIVLFFAGMSLFTADTVSAGNDLPVNNPDLRKRIAVRKSPLNPGKRADEAKTAFADGKIILSLGIGGPNTWKNFAQAIIDSSDNPKAVSTSGVGPLHFRGEFAVSDKIGLAASINYVSASAHWTSMNSSTFDIYNNTIERSSLSIMARLNFHFGESEKWDPYFGFGMGYRSVTWVIKSDDADVNGYVPLPFIPFGFETTIGLRYYITPALGLYGEIGLAKSIGQLGVAVAF